MLEASILQREMTYAMEGLLRPVAGMLLGLSAGCCVLCRALRGVQEVPAGQWFCSGACSVIRTALQAHVAVGEEPIAFSADHSWQLLHGKEGVGGAMGSGAEASKVSLDILQVRYKPL